ncbi:type II 3-dehydroquinate dehydratase [Candidatus Solincola tengchongensis]|uniref:type II 3-dehydroquinate dehydratase n=1 Tax=Candidatus Solincola tengchongensis TaxID=2900693 RepID=UPI002580378D|nr:type II 3-dehydroquinate dehydratase [Candidatus Solincola tengchongensis]
MPLIAVVNGPNLNLLGERDQDMYGKASWEEVREELREKAAELDVELEFYQSNHEGAIVDYLQGLRGRAAGLVINPGALTHYGYSLRDALADLGVPVVEVHISNIFAREEWRSRSVISPVAKGVISGLGTRGYQLALQWLVAELGRG